MDLIFICDDARHLICEPYSRENLHLMAQQLRIKKSWFHTDHYDIPVNRIADVTRLCKVVTTREIIEITGRNRKVGYAGKARRDHSNTMRLDGI